MEKIRRPVLRYQGSKFSIAEWIISFFPPHKIYVEPYGGGAAVLLLKTKSVTEIYNDINSKLYDVFKLLRDKDKAQELKRRLELTPWSYQEYVETDYIDESDDDIERVRKTIVRGYMGVSAGSINRNINGFLVRLDKDRSYTMAQPKAWTTYPDEIEKFAHRIRTVVLENRDAMRVISIYDSDKTLHYVDPPYCLGLWNRQDRKTYSKIMSDDDHMKLLELLKQVSGFVVLSGYDNELYNDTLKDWKKKSRKARNQLNDEREECIWISPKTTAALARRERSLI